jgi:hypothetical protein
MPEVAPAYTQHIALIHRLKRNMLLCAGHAEHPVPSRAARRFQS